jgi:lysyl-tRNA synthetase class 2
MPRRAPQSTRESSIRVLSPSDSLELGAHVRVAGRVRCDRSDGDAAFTLVDALGAIKVEPREGTVSDGDLLLVEGIVGSDRISDAVVLERHPLPSFDRPRLETARFQSSPLARRLRARSRIIAAIREYFESEGFLEVDTPTLVPSPGLDLHLDAFEVVSTRANRFLATSPEYQMKRLLVGGLPRIFQLVRSYRRGEIGARHNPEFTILEWYRAFAELPAVLDDTEALVARAFRAARAEAGLSPALSRLDPTPPFERLSLTDAFARYARIDERELLEMAHSDEERFFRVMLDEVEPALDLENRPIFVCRWPAPMASLARLCPDDPRYAERFELYAHGLELCNGFGELTDPREQRARLLRDQRLRTETGKPVYPLDDRFLGALEEGMPPASGNALGVDRLVMLALGVDGIGDVLAFADEAL